MRTRSSDDSFILKKKLKMIEFKERLSALMRKNNIQKIRELAHRSGVDEKLLGKYLNKKAELIPMPSALNLRKIADALGVSMDYLWTGRHPQNQIVNKKSRAISLIAAKLSSESDCKYITDLIAEIDNFKDPAKVEDAIQIIKILGDLPNEKVETLLKVAQGFKEEKRGGE